MTIMKKKTQKEKYSYNWVTIRTSDYQVDMTKKEAPHSTLELKH